MSTRIASAVLYLTSDSSGLAKDLKSTGAEIDKVQDRFKDLAVAGTALAGAGLVVSGVMTGMTKIAADYGDAINKAHVQTGISTEELSRLKFVAEQTETSFEGLSTGLKFLAKNAVEAANNSKGPAAQGFKELGVSVRDASGHVRPMNDLLLDAADKFSKMEDGPEKAALAMKIFGKSGMDLIPVLNLGREGIIAMGDKAESLGLVLSKKAAKAGDDFNDSIAGVQAASLGLSNAIGQSLMPSLTSAAEFMTSGIAKVTAFAAEHETLTKVVFGLALAIAGVGGLLLAAAGIIAILPTLSSGIMLVTGATTAAAGAQVLLSAAMAAAPFALYAIAIAAVVKVFYDLYATVQNNKAAMESLDKANAQSHSNILKSVDNLKKLGIQIDTAGKSEAQLEKEVRLATQAYYKAHPAIQEKTAAHKKSKEEIDAEAAGVKKLRTAIDAVKESVIGNKDQTNALIKAVTELRKEHISDEAIAKALGSRFIEIRDTLKATGQDIPLVVNHFAALADIQKIMNAQGPIALVPANLKKQEDEYAAAQQKVADGYRTLRIQQVNDSNAQLEDLKTIVAEEGAAAGLTLKIWDDNEAALAQIAKDRGEASARAHEDAAKRFDDAWATATGNMTAGVSKALTDALFHGGNFKDSMVGLLKTTGEGMFQAIVTGFITPFTSAISQIGQNLAKIALDAIGIGSGPVGGILGGVTGSGGILGGILGGGGTAAGGAAAGGAAAGGGAGGLGAASAFLTNPWTIGIGAAIAGAIAWTKSQAHHEANTWVQGFQNPFHAKLADIVDQFNAAYAGGHLGPGNAQKAWDDTHVLWAEFLKQGDAFALKGSDEREVWGNSKNKLGPLMIQIFSDMQGKMAALQAAAAAGAQATTTSQVQAPKPPTTATAQVQNPFSMFSLPEFRLGGPTGMGGLSILHPHEFVVPEQGALVMRPAAAGGNIEFNFSGNIIANSPREFWDGLVRDIDTNKNAIASKLRRALGVK